MRVAGDQDIRLIKALIAGILMGPARPRRIGREAFLDELDRGFYGCERLGARACQRDKIGGSQNFKVISQDGLRKRVGSAFRLQRPYL